MTQTHRPAATRAMPTLATGARASASGLSRDLALCLAFASTTLPAAEPATASQQAIAALVLSGAGPYYTLKLPIAVQTAAAREDLGDLRVRNAAGETMPLAWVPPPATLDLVQRAPVALYKVPAAMSAASAVAAGASASAAVAAPQSWIVDTHDGESDLVRLDLTLAAGAQGVFGLQIEASDDLQRWRVVQAQAQLVQLQQLPVVGGGEAVGKAVGKQTKGAQGTERLTATGIDLDGVPARYLRLTASSAGAVPPLVDATVTRTRRQSTPMPLEWSAPIAPAACEPDHCDYALPRNLTVDALLVDLADADTVGQVTLLGRVDERYAPPHPRHLLRGSLHALHLKNERAPQVETFWDPLASENVYWLTQSGGAPDLHSPPLRLEGQRWPAVRLATTGAISQLGHLPPMLRVGVRPRMLVFLARGAGPFRLERAAAADVATTTMTLADLMPTHAATDPLPAATATAELAAVATSAAATTLPAPSTPTPAPRPPDHTPWLWAALLAGLALMGGMAWTLLRKPAPVPAAMHDLEP